jgi:hypothetical protein
VAVGADKLLVSEVTYGTFAPDADGDAWLASRGGAPPVAVALAATVVVLACTPLKPARASGQLRAALRPPAALTSQADEQEALILGTARSAEGTIS